MCSAAQYVIEVLRDPQCQLDHEVLALQEYLPDSDTTGMDLGGAFHCMVIARDVRTAAIVGTTLLEWNSDSIMWQLWNVVVHPDHRLRGLCKSMIDRVKQEVADLEESKMRLGDVRRMPYLSVMVNADSTMWTNGGYEKLGFTDMDTGPNDSVREMTWYPFYDCI